MTVREDVVLAPYTSLSIGGPARFLIEAACEQDVREVALFAVSKHLPLVPLGGGTNILVPDVGIDAVVLTLCADDIIFEPDEASAKSGEPQDDGTVLLIASAGASWDALVKAAGERELWGIENLAGIPGRAAGALVQNIGAYGAELADVFAWADVLDLRSGERLRLIAPEAQLGYRSSRFKRERHLLIMRVALRLARAGVPRLAYADLARAQGAGASLTTPGDIGTAVRSIRADKFPKWGEGYLEGTAHPSRKATEGTAGSFFKNPVISEEHARAVRERFPSTPQFPQEDGRVKIALAWLLDHALALKGFSVGRARLYEKQPLVIVASEGATAGEVDALAREVAERVHEATSIVIEREVETFCAR
ncbi:MAG: FAD-binding protein [bacterium]|nr:FAD-binding protein [bacterium]